MSRLTGTDAYSLMEAYSAVYAPQELTEEQVWEEVETWVNDLIEEGYDLSDYTWEEMYESYIEEQGRPGSAAIRNQNVFKFPTSSAGTRRGAAAGTKTPTPTFQNTGGYGRYGAPETQVKTPVPTTNTRTPSRLTPGVTTVPIRPRTPVPAARPASAAPTRPAAAAPARPAATAPASPKPAAPAGGSALDRATAAAFSPKPQSDVGAMITRSQARQTAQTPKPATSTATAKPTPRQARLNMEMEYDTFDTVMEYLVAEGYADTEESALVIMANMSEEWRESIVEGMFDFLPKSTTVIPGKYGKNTVLSKKGGVEGVSDKSKPGSFTPQKGGFDKMDAERYAMQHSKQGTSSGTSGINVAGRRETSGRVK